MQTDFAFTITTNNIRLKRDKERFSSEMLRYLLVDKDINIKFLNFVIEDAFITGFHCHGILKPIDGLPWTNRKGDLFYTHFRKIESDDDLKKWVSYMNKDEIKSSYILDD